MSKLLDIHPKYAAHLFEFSCIRKLTSGSGSNWHMLCSYDLSTWGWNHLVALMQIKIGKKLKHGFFPLKARVPLGAWFGK